MSIDERRLALPTKHCINVYKYYEREQKWQLSSKVAFDGDDDLKVSIDKDIMVVVTATTKLVNKAFKLKMIGGKEEWVESANLNMVWRRKEFYDYPYYNLIDGNHVFTVRPTTGLPGSLPGKIFIHDISHVKHAQ